jgi:hypothetical protein
MENKILIELIVPVLEEKYDVFIPLTKKVGNVLNLVVKTVAELTDSKEAQRTQLNFYSGETGEKLDKNILIMNANLKNGSRLILM